MAVAPTLLFPPVSSTVTVKACINEVIHVLASRNGLNRQKPRMKAGALDDVHLGFS